ncbi:hypothetical protein Lalb_Chr21g0316641 [Lupinus albus]|uniref:Uncharacterized protein n=1 Tax=Lupinus albus TaxID=3870 RepID=A0A6A4NDT5_LUPAL|nr:hypothetical protein Lalb_Chr21g0316641 [Lupinus albus]
MYPEIECSHLFCDVVVKLCNSYMATLTTISLAVILMVCVWLHCLWCMRYSGG